MSNRSGSMNMKKSSTAPPRSAQQASTSRPPQGIIGASGTGDTGADDSCGMCLTILLWVFLILTFPFSVCCCIKIVKEYERAVIFSLGRLVSGGAKGYFLRQSMHGSLRLRRYSHVHIQRSATRGLIQRLRDRTSGRRSVFRISNAVLSVANVENAIESTKLLAQTTLRNILGTKTLAEMLSDREAIAHLMQSTLDYATDPWGVTVERVEIKNMRLPEQLQRAMAAEAEATREAKAKVIAAEGEMNASKALRDAANIIAASPAALQLRYLQTLNTIAAEKNSIIIFPLPIDLLTTWVNRK